MISSKNFFCAARHLCFGSQALAKADHSTHTVIKSDGSSGCRRFMPVKYDPTHAAVVEQRLNQQTGYSSLPATYSIGTDLISPIRDQGSRGTCAYFATLGVLESYYIAKTPAHTPLSLSIECLVGVRDWMFDQKTKYTRDDKPDQRPDPDGDYLPSLIKTIDYEGVPASQSIRRRQIAHTAALAQGRLVSILTARFTRRFPRHHSLTARASYSTKTWLRPSSRSKVSSLKIFPLPSALSFLTISSPPMNGVTATSSITPHRTLQEDTLWFSRATKPTAMAKHSLPSKIHGELLGVTEAMERSTISF